MLGEDLSRLSYEFDRLALDFTEPSDNEKFDAAQASLKDFKVSPDLYRYVIPFYTSSALSCSKFLILTMFKDTISSSWLNMPYQAKDSIGQFFFNIISSNEMPPEGDSILSMADAIMIEILKLEWPQNFSNFTRNLINRARESNACVNAVKIFNLLSQEIYTSVKFGMTAERRIELEITLSNNSPLIISFFGEILRDCSNLFLAEAVLSALESYLVWLDPIQIQDGFLVALVRNLFPVDELKLPILKCFAAIPNSITESNLIGKLVDYVFILLVEQLNLWLVDDFNFEEFSNNNESLCHALVLSLTEFLSFQKYRLLFGLGASPHLPSASALKWLLALTNIVGGTAFDICLGFWEEIAKHSHVESPCVHLPIPFAFELQKIIINRFLPPPGFVLGDEGTANLHQSMYDIIVNTGKNEHHQIVKYILDNFPQTPPNQSVLQFSWAAAAILSALPEDEETQFVVLITDNLINRIDSDPPIFAISLMTIISASNRFFITNLPYFASFVERLLNWMSDPDQPEIQKFAANTFSTIANRFHNQLLSTKTLFFDILQNCDNYSMMLPPDTTPQFYSSLTYVIKSNPNQFSKQDMVPLLLRGIMARWNEIVSEIDSILTNISQFTLIANIFAKIISIGDPYINSNLTEFIDQVHNLFKAVSTMIQPTEDYIVHQRLKESLYLIFQGLFIAECGESSQAAIDILTTIIDDYKSIDPSIRLPEALQCITTFLEQLKIDDFDVIQPIIIDVVFSSASTISTIEFCEPEIEMALFNLITVIIRHSFSSIESLTEDHLLQLYECIEWGMTRSFPDVVEIVLNSIIMIINNASVQFADVFFQHFYVRLLYALFQTLLNLPSDSLFDIFSRVIHLLFIKIQYFQDTPETAADDLANRLSKDFVYLETSKLYDFILYMIHDSSNYHKFRSTLYDLMIDLGHGVLNKEPHAEEEDQVVIPPTPGFPGSFTPPEILDLVSGQGF